MSLWLTLLAALLAASASAQPLYHFGPDSSIVQLTDENFEKEVVADSRHVWVVEYYADWCGHCKAFAKGYEKAAGNLKGIVKFGAVNADEAKATANTAGVQGFPTVKLYLPEVSRNPYTGKMFKPSLDYNGPRTARGVVDFATGAIPSLVTSLDDETMAGFSRNGSLPKAVLFTSKSDTPTMLKALSLKFQGRMLLGIARDSAKQAVADLGVESFPSVYVLGEGEAKAVKYDGELKAEALGAFLEKHAAPEAEAAAAAAKGVGAPALAEVNSSNVDSLVKESREPWLLVFESAETPMGGSGAEELVQSVYGQVSVGTADASLTSTYGVKALPALVMLPFGTGNKGAKRAKIFAADQAGVAAAKKAALESIPDNFVERLNEATTDRWISTVMVGSELKAMVLLFSDKAEVPPIFRSVAMEFEGKMGFGMLGKSMMARFNVQKLPTLLVMFPGEMPKAEAGGDAAQVQLQGMQFTPQVHGKFSYGNIASFLAEFIAMRTHELQAKGEHPGAAGAGGAEGASPESEPQKAAKKELGPLPELSRANFAAECADKGGLCAIALLDGASENTNKQTQLEMLTQLRAKRHGGPLAFSWLDATCHAAFLAHFGLSEMDLPTMLVISPSKLRWARAVGAFDAETLGTFGAAVASGRMRTDPLQELPQLEDVDCAVVKRGADAVVDEDDGGSEDILAEILEEERLQREEREAAAAAAAAAAAPDGAASEAKASRELSEIERLEAELEDCTAMDLLCTARNEKTQKKIEKRRELEAKLKEIAKKKKKKAKKAKKAAA